MGGADGPAVGVGVWAGAWQSWSAADPLSHAGAPPAYTTLRLQADRGAARGLNSYIYIKRNYIGFMTFSLIYSKRIHRH